MAPLAYYIDLDLDWVKSQDFLERVIVRLWNLSKLRNLPLISKGKMVLQMIVVVKRSNIR